jgi:hypothetical protein
MFALPYPWSMMTSGAGLLASYPAGTRTVTGRSPPIVIPVESSPASSPASPPPPGADCVGDDLLHAKTREPARSERQAR